MGPRSVILVERGHAVYQGAAPDARPRRSCAAGGAGERRTFGV